MLNSSLTYNVYIHDPHFFIFTFNPSTIPGIFLYLKSEEGLHLRYIDVVHHVNMDRPQQHCEAAEDYSLTACVKNSVARKVGCRYILTTQWANSLRTGIKYLSVNWSQLLTCIFQDME